jgi:hypothetical protein
MSTLSSKVVDFTNVKDATGSFNKKRVPAGDYLAKITKAEDAVAKGDGVFQYLFTIRLEKYSQLAYPYYCKLTENQLWKLRNLLIAAGINVPKKRVKLDPSKVIGKFIGVTMEDDEYDGKLQSTISAVFPASELGEADTSTPSDDDEDDAEDEAEEEAEEEIEDPEEESETDKFVSMDRNELKAFIKERDPSFRFLKSQTDDDLRDSAKDLDTDASDEEASDEEESDDLEELDISDL